MADIKFVKRNNVYDIEFSNGDIVLTDGMDTALLISFLSEQRANSGEISTPEFRGGWWGNIFNGTENFEFGSKLWLLKNSPNTDETLNRAITYTQEAFKWIVENDKASQIEVTGTRTQSNIELFISIIRDNEVINGVNFNLWESTSL